MDGIINLLKPVGMSSHQAVGIIKKITGVKKAGHTGTLDPGAAGVLPVCLGKATKLADIISGFEKAYRTEITFGVVTDTQDMSGKVLKAEEVCVSSREIEEALEGFKGAILQVPPMYSALKYRGERLYRLARQGMDVERKARSVNIYDIRMVDYFPPCKAIIDIRCSKGTYIRTLCHDIGSRTGYGAAMSYLVRISSGCFTLEDTVTFEELSRWAADGTLAARVLPMDYPLQGMEKAEVNDRSLRFALNGNPLFPHNMVEGFRDFNEGQQLRIYHRDDFIGIGKLTGKGDGMHILMHNVLYKGL